MLCYVVLLLCCVGVLLIRIMLAISKKTPSLMLCLHLKVKYIVLCSTQVNFSLNRTLIKA